MTPLQKYWSCVLLGAPVMTAFGQELQATAQLHPTRATVKTPSIQATSDDAKLIPKPNNLWLVELTDQKKALSKASIAFAAQPPSEYKTQIVQVRVPYISEGPVKVVLFAVNVDDSTKRVREIFGTNIADTNLSTRELFRLYQEAAYISQRRLADIQDPGKDRAFNLFDAQIFFKYLEVARELGRRVNLVMSSEVQGVQTYLREQSGLEEGQKVLNKAVPRGKEDVLALANDIDFVDAEHLRRLWQTLERQPEAYSGKACDGYRAFLTTVTYDFDDALVKRWSEHKDYTMVKLATDRFKVCVERESAAKVKDSAAVVNALQPKAFVTGDVERSFMGVRRALEMRTF